MLNRRFLALLSATAGATLVFAAPSSAAASTYFVAPSGSTPSCAANSQADPFATIQDALACSDDGDEISLAPSGATSYAGIGTVSDDVTIAAQAGADASTVRVDVSSAPLTVPAGASVTVAGATLACEDGLKPTPELCGPNVANHGTLTLDGVAVSGATKASAIENFAVADAAANLTVRRSTISDNPNYTGGEWGAGIRSNAVAPTALTASVTIVNSTIANNGDGVTRGGGVSIEWGTADLINTTITNNEAGAQGGGGLAVTAPGHATLTNTLIAGNTSTGGGPDCSTGPSATIEDGAGGHNLIGDPTNCATTGPTNGDIVGIDAGLGALADNGGPTETVALQTSNPAIGAGDLSTCESSPVGGRDQRGELRNGPLGCDIGAYDTGTAGGVVAHTYFVAPSGSTPTCAANSQANPFATIQDALACADDGDLVSLAPSGSGLYPGIGTVSEDITIAAQAGADAKSVRIDVSSAPLTVPAGESVTVNDAALVCVDRFDATGNLCGPNVTNHGTLTLDGVTVTGSTKDSAIKNLAVTDAAARLIVRGSTIADNADFTGTVFGAGITSNATGVGAVMASVMIANSTIANNGLSNGGSTLPRGGGVAIEFGTADLINTTITNNGAGTRGGGGLAVDNGSQVTLGNTLIAGNVSPGSAPDCSVAAGGAAALDGPGGHNLIGDPTGCTISGGTNGDITGVDPLLGSLADNGGATQTVALESSSPAIGAGDVATCQGPPISGNDQRGSARGSTSCDIGAFETMTPPPVTQPTGTPPGDTTPPAGTPPADTPPDTTPAMRDLTPPALEITKAPKAKVKTRKRAARVTVRFRSEPGATFVCGVDDRQPEPCSAPFKARLKSGHGKGRRHTIAIVATDAAGNASPHQTVTVRVIRKGRRG